MKFCIESSLTKSDGFVPPKTLITEFGYRKSSLAPKGVDYVAFLFDDVQTVFSCFMRGHRLTDGKGNCLGTQRNGQYEWITYEQTLSKSRRFGAALKQRGLQRQQLFGIWAQNCEGWTVADLACNMFSFVSIPLYNSMLDEGISYILRQTELQMLLIDKHDAKLRFIVQHHSLYPHLKYVIVISDAEKLPEEWISLTSETDIELIPMCSLINTASTESAQPDKSDLPTADDLFTICYTSGTTGDPKGVMLSHRNVLAGISGSAFHLQAANVMPNSNDVHISYLPLSHMLERDVQAILFLTGGSIGFFGGNVLQLPADIKLLRPTVWVTVPRLLNRIYDKVQGEVSGSRLKSALLQRAIQAKSAEVQQGLMRKNSFWDWLVFRKLQNALGGRIRAIMSASAPLSAEVLQFCRAAFGCPVLEGYGQTECSAGCTCSWPAESTIGHVGTVLACNIIKLVDVEDMDYLAAENRGEICVRGPNVMKGYYKMPDKTAEAIDEDGWLHTGDIGEWTKEGNLKIIDRKKNIFKLSQGEYVAPEKVENIYMLSRFVSQVFVDGSSLHNFPLAVIVPNFEEVVSWAKEHGISQNEKELCKNLDVKKAILEDVVSVGKARGLKGFEQAKDIYVHPDAFLIENELLTPTFKLKRTNLRKFFAAQFEVMYSQAAAEGQRA